MPLSLFPRLPGGSMYCLAFVSILILLLQTKSAYGSLLYLGNLEGRELTGAPTCKTNISITLSKDECSTHCTPIQDIQKRCDDFYPCMCKMISPAALDSCLKCTASSSETPIDTPSTLSNESVTIITEFSNACSFVRTENTMNRAYLPCRSSSNALFGHTLTVSPAELLRYLIPYMSVATAAMIFIVITDSARKKR